MVDARHVASSSLFSPEPFPFPISNWGEHEKVAFYLTDVPACARALPHE
jgi:hypothetical protein